MAAPLILARTFKEAHAYAQERLGLKIGHYRVVNSVGTIKAVRNTDLHLVPGWEKRVGYHAFRSALRWSRLNVIDGSQQAAPPADDRGDLTERQLDVAYRYNALLDEARREAALPKIEIAVVPDDTPTPQHHLDMVAKVLPSTSNGDNVIAEGAPDVAEKPKRKRRSRCTECGNLHFKDERCPTEAE